jgi:hypothetical protein
MPACSSPPTSPPTSPAPSSDGRCSPGPGPRPSGGRCGGCGRRARPATGCSARTIRNGRGATASCSRSATTPSRSTPRSSRPGSCPLDLAHQEGVAADAVGALGQRRAVLPGFCGRHDGRPPRASRSAASASPTTWPMPACSSPPTSPPTSPAPYVALALDLAHQEGVAADAVGALGQRRAVLPGFCGMRYRPDDPEWEGRDRFLLSIGHYAIALYAALLEASCA